MSFPRYPKYKPSGVEWLGEVPAHWEVMPIRFAARLESGHTPSRQHPEYWENCHVPWFSLADVWQRLRTAAHVPGSHPSRRATRSAPARFDETETR